VDPSGFQPSLIDSSGPVGIWQGTHPSHHHPGRLPFMPPRDLHFPYENFISSFLFFLLLG